MSDPIDLAIGAGGGATVVGLLVGLLRTSGARNVTTLDATLLELAGAVKDLRSEVQHLRESGIGLAKDIGALNERLAAQGRELEVVRRHVHRWGAFLQKLTLKTATGEHVKIEVPEEDDDE